MLVLARNANQQVVITTPEGRTIEVLVTAIRGDVVKLGFVADREVSVHRKEIADAIKRQKLLTPDAAILEAAEDCCS